jgi:hypothetical protein
LYPHSPSHGYPEHTDKNKTKKPQKTAKYRRVINDGFFLEQNIDKKPHRRTARLVLALKSMLPRQGLGLLASLRQGV